MDSWVTDGFYSHFPSYSQQPSKREALAKARQLEYQKFLSRVSPPKIAKAEDGKAQKRHTSNDSPNKRQKVPTNDITLDMNRNSKLPKLDTKKMDDNNGESDMSSRVEVKNKFLDELEKMDLPDIINEKLISKRNEKLKEEKRLNTLRYQQDLLEQIEQKRRERELQKAKDKYEEEKLTKRMEEQLKMVRLHDDFENQCQTRQREKSRINLELNRPMVSQQLTKPPITVRSEQLEVTNSRMYDERKAQTDRGKENWDELKRNDKEIYNYFTNSAHNPLKDIRYSHYFDLEDLSENEVLPSSMSSYTYNTYPSKLNRHPDTAHKQQQQQQPNCQHNKKQLPDIKQRPMCNFCKHNRFLTRNQQENLANGYICSSCENEPVCLNCREEICYRCKRPTNNDEHEHGMKMSERHLKQRNIDQDYVLIKKAEPQSKPKLVHLENFHPIFTDEDDSLSDLSLSDHKPYTFNIDESSIFHPSKSRLNHRLSVSIRNGEVFIQPDSFDELKRITDEKFQKYSKNYGEFRIKTSTDAKELRSIETKIPVPISKLNLNTESNKNSISDYSRSPSSDPMTVMRENTKKLIEFAKELDHGKKNCFRRIEAKHQIPTVQTNKVIQNSDVSSTLTQVGAIKKQLLLDKLNF